MHERRAVLIGIFMGFCLFTIMHGSAQMLPLVDRYHNNTRQIADLDLNRTRLEQNTSDLMASITELEGQIQNGEHNTTLLRSEIAGLDRTIEEETQLKNTTEQKLHRLAILSEQLPTIVLGTVTGIIAGLWGVLVFLVLLWRK